MEGLHLLAVQAAEIQTAFVGQQMLELVDGQGLIIVKALGIPAAHTAQDVFLVEGFHTLHNDGQAHHASHG